MPRNSLSLDPGQRFVIAPEEVLAAIESNLARTDDEPVLQNRAAGIALANWKTSPGLAVDV